MNSNVAYTPKCDRVTVCNIQYVDVACAADRALRSKPPDHHRSANRSADVGCTYELVPLELIVQRALLVI
jgi:hypothetical protein